MFQRLVSSYLERLEKKRLSQGLSRRQWLKQMNVAQSTWYRWKKGETVPNARTIERLEKQASR